MAKQAKSRALNVAPVKPAQKILDAAEIERLRVWGYIACAEGVREGALAVVLLGAGGRRFETAALRCRDVRMGLGGPEVYFPEVKGGGTATVPISEDTWKALSEWTRGKPESAPLIPTESGEFMHVATLWRTFKEALTQAGVQRQVGVHATRHAAGFLLLRATSDLTKVQVFLRHKSLSTTANWYKHVYLPDLRAGLAKAGI